jgi:hypothetical protein
MKRFLSIVTILMLMIAANPLFADCGGGSYSVWPKSKTLHPNGIIVIGASGDKFEYGSGIGVKYPAYLICDSVRVKLVVLERHTGDYDMTQVLLKPAVPLKSGAVYELRIDSLPLIESGSRKYNYDLRREEMYQWKISDSNDTLAPVWNAKPHVTSKSYVQYGCGPEMHVNFNYQIADSSAVLLRTTVTNSDTKKKTTYCLAASDTAVSVGMYMCGGEFVLKRNVIYEVTFDIIDASGNVTPWIGKPIQFTAANKETE